jgi:hypothetical protein
VSNATREYGGRNDPLVKAFHERHAARDAAIQQLAVSAVRAKGGTATVEEVLLEVQQGWSRERGGPPVSAELTRLAQRKGSPFRFDGTRLSLKES